MNINHSYASTYEFMYVLLKTWSVVIATRYVILYVQIILVIFTSAKKSQQAIQPLLDKMS